jgi:hypothetical protein
MVVSIVDADDFTLQVDGYVSAAGLTGMTGSTVYFLDPSTAGRLTSTEPSTTGQVSKPLLVADSGASGYLFNWRGEKLTNTSSFLPISDAFGDGSDGPVTLTQTDAAPAWATKTGSGASTVFALTRDVYFTNLTLDNSNGNFALSTLGPSGANTVAFRIYASGALTVQSGITVRSNGLDAVANARGGQAFSTFGGGAGTNGGNGVVGAGTGVAGGSTTASLATTATVSAEQGGAGGAASGGPGTGGGTAGGGGASTFQQGWPHTLTQFMNGQFAGNSSWQSGAGGSGGDSTATSTSGGGGAGSPTLYLAALQLVNNGVLQSKGGAGGNASGSGTGAGGGGGGGGGAIVLMYGSSGSSVGTTDVTGGAGGTAQGAGKNGADGHSGLVWTMAL